MQTMSKIKQPTQELTQAGQSPWLDFISRDLIQSGKLKSLITDSGILGVTSNPSIFEKAINQKGSVYEKDIHHLLGRGVSTFDIYDALTIQDIHDAFYLFSPFF